MHAKRWKKGNGMKNISAWQVKIQFFFSRHIFRPKPHVFLYRLTGGIVGSRLPGMPLVDWLLLTVRGRKTGKLRTCPLCHFQVGQQTVVAASNGGKDHHPSWYWNLRSNPDAVVQLGRSQREVRARLAEGPERERLWSAITQMLPVFALYQQQTTREIPVFILEPVQEKSGKVVRHLSPYS